MVTSSAPARVKHAEPTTPVLEARGLTAGYSAQPVVRDIDLVINRGEVVALLGANGAGKTTTLLALAGELAAMSGDVLVDGEKSTAPLHMRVRNGLAFVPEERSIFKGMTCWDNLRVGRADPEYALTLFPELKPRLRVRGGLLSGGEQQMLSLGRALSLKPRLLLVDELSLGLAPLIVQKLLAAIREAATKGCAVLLVEQHVRQAIKMADTVHIMRRGRIELSGVGTELLERIDEVEGQYFSAGARTA